MDSSHESDASIYEEEIPVEIQSVLYITNPIKLAKSRQIPLGTDLESAELLWLPLRGYPLPPN